MIYCYCFFIICYRFFFCCYCFCCCCCGCYCFIFVRMKFCMRFLLCMNEMKWNGVCFNWIYNYTIGSWNKNFDFFPLFSVYWNIFEVLLLLRVWRLRFIPSFRRALCVCMCNVHVFRFSYENCINSWLFSFSLLTEQQFSF